MGKTLYSGERAHKTKKVVLRVLGLPYQKKVIQCRRSAGRNTDKMAKFNIDLMQISGIFIKILVYTLVAIVCNLKEYYEVGDHYLYICDLTDVLSNKKE